MKGLRSIGFFKLLAASAFFVSASVASALPITIKFHGRAGDLTSEGTTVSPNNHPDEPGGVAISSSLGPKTIPPTVDPSGTGDPNVLLGPIVPVSPPISAPHIAPIADPTGIGDPNVLLAPIVPVSRPTTVPQGVVSPNTPVTAPDGGSSIEMLSIGLLTLLLFRWNMARAAKPAI